MTTAKIGIIMGSASDADVVKKGISVLEDLNIPFEIAIASAHRTPEDANNYARNAQSRGISVLIAVAGLSAALPGVIAAACTLPVIGVPVKGGAMDGMDAMLSITQMPPGVPVASVGLNGIKNACLMSVRILAINDLEIRKKLEDWIKIEANKVIQSRKEMKELPMAPDDSYK